MFLEAVLRIPCFHENGNYLYTCGLIQVILLIPAAILFIDDKEFGEVTANKKFEISLRANQTYKVRFVNEILNVDTIHEFYIKEGEYIRKLITLDIPAKNRPTEE